MKITSLKVDSKRANEGAWVKDLPGMGDLRLRVRGWQYEPYQTEVAKESAKIGPSGRQENRADGPLLRPVFERITGLAMAAHLLLEWDGLQNPDGSALPYTLDDAITFLTHPDFRPFNAFVTMACSEVERLDSNRVQASVGNSSLASDIKSSGVSEPNT